LTLICAGAILWVYLILLHITGDKKMKKTMIAVLTSFAISSFAMAAEEIQLAAAIGSGAGETAAGGSMAGGTAAATGAAATANMVAIGVIAATGIAAAAEAGSTTNH
jgi:hypothetical protein